MMTRRLTGGQRGYRIAVDEAFLVNMHNPSVVYSEREGFTVQSTLTPLDDDEYRVGEAVYCLNNDGQRNMNGGRAEYAVVRARVFAWLDARAAGHSRRRANDAANDAAYAFEASR